MNDKVKKVLFYILIAIVLGITTSICYNNYRLNAELKSLTKSIESCRNTTAELGERINDQKQYIDELEQISRRLESAIERTDSLYRELEEVESNVDGYTGAVRGTVDNVSRTIELTIEAIEQEGITD